jgi:hypothetical protein
VINPYTKKAIIYRQNGETEEINDFSIKLSGEDVLPDFELDLKILE